MVSYRLIQVTAALKGAAVFFQRSCILDIILIETAGLSFAEVSGFLPCVTKARRESILRKRGEGDKVNALLAELLVLSEIRRRGGARGLRQRVEFERGPFGKPYVKGGGSWFSLSHTKGAVCAAFSAQGEVGTDIEPRSRRISEGLYARVLSESERAQVRTAEDFLRAWVRKEAFLKRLGVGITRDLRGVDTAVMPDTVVLEKNGFFIGASGEGAQAAGVAVMQPDELLTRYVKR